MQLKGKFFIGSFGTHDPDLRCHEYFVEYRLDSLTAEKRCKCAGKRNMAVTSRRADL